MIPVGCCGDDCNYCPRYTGTVNNNREALIKTAELWYRMGWRDRIVEPDELRCNGCISIKSCPYAIKECCSEKNIDNCGYCIDMPCGRLIKMFDDIKENRKKIEALIKEGAVKEEEDKALNKAFWLKEQRLKRIYNKIYNEKNK